jgi:uncharacterized protein (DUF58 family)
VAVVVFYYAASSEVAWLFLLAYWVAALILVAYAYALWNRGLRGELGVKGTRPTPGSPRDELPEQVLRSGPYPAPIFEGDRVTLGLRLSGARGARGPARLAGRVGQEALSAAAGVVPKSGWTSDRELGPLQRGPIGATGWVLESGDPLGLFRCRSATADAEVGLVLPRFTSLGAHEPVRELEASAAAPRSGTGTEVFGVREYQPGDPLRRIHWRSSARHGELIVREYEPPGMQTLGILCDPHPPSREAADQVARLAASETWDCLRAGGRVVLWAPGCEPSSPDDSRSLWALLEWLARYSLPLHGAVGPARGAGAARGGGAAEPWMTDAVAIVASGDPRLLEVLDGVRQRGGSARAWVVDDSTLEADVPSRRCGLGWPP